MSERDRAPVDQRWIQAYCDQFLKVSEQLHGPMREASLRRVECVMDMLDSWQKRNWPHEERR